MMFGQMTLGMLGSRPRGGGVPPYLGQVATRAGYFPTGFAPSNKQFNSFTCHTIREDVTSIQVEFPNFYIDPTTFLETNTGADATISATIEYPIGGTKHRLKFGGSNDGTIPNGGRLLSDALAVSIPDGERFRLRMWYRNSAGIPYVDIKTNADINGDGFQYGVTVTDKTESGTTSPGTLMYFPTAIVAQTTKPSVYWISDSIGHGTGDTINDATSDVGLFARSIGPDLGYVSGGVHGDQASIAKNNYAKRLPIADYCSHIICELGINAVIAGAQTPAQMMADLQAIYALFGDKPIYQSTITPYAPSNNVHASNANRIALNALIRAVPAPLAGIFEVADVVEPSRNAGTWKSGYSTDFLHPDVDGYTAVRDSGVIDTSVFTYPHTPAPAVPVNSVAPTISGNSHEGQTLTINHGTWSNTPTSYTYRWLRDGVPISGATSQTYVLDRADVLSLITGEEVGVNAGGAGTAVASSNSIQGRLKLHARVAQLGDGLLNGTSAAPGQAAPVYHALEYTNGRLRPSVGFDQAASGETFASMTARVGQVNDQQADVIIIHGSHNDFNGSYTHTTNSLWNSVWTNVAGYISKFETLIAAVEAGSPHAIIVVIITFNSNIGGNESVANIDTVWAYQRARGTLPFTSSRGPSGKGRTVICDLGGTGASPYLNPATDMIDGTHFNQIGGKKVGRGKLGPLLDTLVQEATVADMLNTRTASGALGADIMALTEYKFEGTTGQVAGTISPTGSFAVGKRVTNNLANGTSVAVTGSKDTSHASDPWPYEIQDVAISGTPAAANNVVLDEATSPSSTVTLGVSSAVIGTFWEVIAHWVMDDGAGGAPDVRSYQLALGSFGQHNVATSAANVAADYDFALDTVVRTAPKSVYQTNPALIAGNLNVNPAFTTRLSAVAQQTRLRRDRQMVRKVDLEAYAAPKLIENYLTGSSDKLQIIGTPGGTNALIAAPGQWSGGAITYDPKWYIGGSLVASGWTYTQASPAPGTVIEFRPNPTNSFGSDLVTNKTVTVP